MKRMAGVEEDDSKLSELLLQRNKLMVPESGVIAQLDALYARLETALGEFKDGINESPFEETRKVGAYSNETLIRGDTTGEMLLVFKEAPELDQSGLIASLTTQLADCEVAFDADNASIRVTHGSHAIHCFITCNGQKIRTVEERHFAKKLLYRHFDMRKRAHWFGEYGQEPNVRVLARIIGDMRRRYQGLNGLTQWSVELLAHYCVTGVRYNEQGQMAPLSMASSFRRFLMILSSGFFLPGSSGIRDPIERDGRSVHQNFAKGDMDAICATMQTLLRVVMQGAPEKVIGLDSSDNCDMEMQIIDGVVIQPSMTVYTDEQDQSSNRPEEME